MPDVVANLTNPNRWGSINYRTEPFNARLADNLLFDNRAIQVFDPLAADSRANAESVLAFQADGTLPVLKPRPFQLLAHNASSPVAAENVWGTAPQAPGEILRGRRSARAWRPGPRSSSSAASTGPPWTDRSSSRPPGRRRRPSRSTA